MRNENIEMVCEEGDVLDGQLFVGYVQAFSDKTGTSLKSTVLIAYAVHDLLMNFEYLFRRWLTENGHMVLGTHQ